MWLHIPPSFLENLPRAWPYVQDQEDWNLDSLSPSEKNIKLWVTLSANPTQRPLSSSIWKKRPWVKHLFGTILRPSKAEIGAAVWILSLRAFRVSLSVLPEAKNTYKTKDGFGLQSKKPFAMLGRVSSLWKMYPTSKARSQKLSTKFSETWPNSGSMRNGKCWEQTKLVPPTLGRDYFYWPTPTHHDSKGYGPSSLERHSACLPTKAPLLWATPTTESTMRTKRYNQGGHPISFQALSLRARMTLKGGEPPLITTLQLNPRFVEVLMGLPLGWTDLNLRGTLSYQLWRQQHSWHLASVLEYLNEQGG